MWAPFVNTAIGIWMMAAPGVLGFGTRATDLHHIFGPVVATFAIVSIWEATRSVRLWNVLPGAFLLVAPFVLGFETGLEIIHTIVAGVLILLCAVVRGPSKHRFAGGWASLVRSEKT